MQPPGGWGAKPATVTTGCVETVLLPPGPVTCSVKLYDTTAVEVLAGSVTCWLYDVPLQGTAAGRPVTAGEALSWHVLASETPAVRFVTPPAVGRPAGEALKEVIDGCIPVSFRCTDLVTWCPDFTAFNVTVNCRGAADGFAPTWKLTTRCPEEQLRVFGSPARRGVMLILHEVACLTAAWRRVVPPAWLSEVGDSVSDLTVGRFRPAASAVEADRQRAPIAARFTESRSARPIVACARTRRPHDPFHRLIIHIAFIH